MVYTVTFNPSLDYIVSVDNFRMGIVNRTTKELMYPGGKGINVSIVLSNLGIKNTAFGFVAGFTGEEIVKKVREKDIEAEFIFVKEGNSRINVKLRSDKETEINGKGPEILEENVEELYKKLDFLEAGDILVLAGSIPDVMPKTIYMDIMEYLKEKKIRVVVDATKELLLNVLPFHPFLIKPNNHELGEIFGVEIKTKDQVVEYAKKLQKKGAENVLVSMAGEGAVLVTEEGQEFRSEAPKGIVINSVGAGDSMVAGFLYGYIKGKDYKEAFAYGVCTGSASAFSEELAEKEQVEELVKQYFGSLL